ncbi:hypothetical protein [Flavobacterium sp. BFFFF1]|uniref:hypothetical protein n=1 Tax=Flavobacterium sp. BFFFF1 TaxID=2015557 RepID=UPI0025B7D8E2|nr:hypothetical protein [Flavobacterium sp. BFFFF1]
MRELVSLLMFLYSLNSFSQDLIDVALRNKSVLILNEAYIIPNSQINYLELDSIDKSIIEEFKLQANEQKASNWNESDFKDRILIKNKERINVDKVLTLSPNLTDRQKKDLRKAIKIYNSTDDEWRTFPLQISKPLYSKQRDYAVIGFIDGNSGGTINLFHLENGEWKSIGGTRWAY